MYYLCMPIWHCRLLDLFKVVRKAVDISIVAPLIERSWLIQAMVFQRKRSSSTKPENQPWWPWWPTIFTSWLLTMLRADDKIVIPLEVQGSYNWYCVNARYLSVCHTTNVYLCVRLNVLIYILLHAHLLFTQCKCLILMPNAGQSNLFLSRYWAISWSLTITCTK